MIARIIELGKWDLNFTPSWPLRERTRAGNREKEQASERKRERESVIEIHNAQAKALNFICAAITIPAGSGGAFVSWRKRESPLPVCVYCARGETLAAIWVELI